jgi:Glycosyl transferases group 1
MSKRMQPAPPGKRLIAIWSRDVDPARLAGRTQMIQAIRREISSNYQAEHVRIENALEKRSLRSILGAVSSALKTLASGHLPSLQCLLFCDFANHEKILQLLRERPPEILYCDGVRTYYVLQRIVKERGKIRIVVDLDDLMSRRMQSLSTADTPLSLGYLQERMPARLRGALALGFFSKALARYEQAALTHVENDIGLWADAVVLISQMERDALQARYQELGCSAQVYAVPPPLDVKAPPQKYSAFSRFIFIGTDALPQNKLSIQFITDLWRERMPDAEIHLFGHMLGDWSPLPGVIFRGYATSLRDVYVEGAVMLAPGVLRGGLKTKVAEAFSYGCAVVGNAITFEGLHLDNYPLIADSDDEIADLVMDPSAYLPAMVMAAKEGQEYLKTHVSRKQFEQNWKAILG